MTEVNRVYKDRELKKTNSKNKQKQLKRLAEMRMFDDTFMSAVFDKRKTETELLIQIILERDDIKVISTKSQADFSNIYGRKIRLDILARDAQKKAYNIEVQRELTGASVRRARFHAAMLDVSLLDSGQEFNKLPERYTIFITEDDMFGKGIPTYHIENKITELNDRPLNDGGHIIYVNGQYKDTNTPIGVLMHDFSCINANDIITPILRERVKYLKEAKGGQQKMCKIMEDMIEEMIMEEKIEAAKKFIAIGKLSLKEIADALELPIAKVKELAQKKPA